LFQILIDRLRAVAQRYRTAVPLYLMTSSATHQATQDYFNQLHSLGTGDDQLRLFCQGQMPAIDAASGRILLARRHEVALSPDGHGGMLAALDRSGCLADAHARGIELFFYGQVDNPLLQVCDPFFLGCHLLAQSEMTTQVVRKQDPAERVGNVVEIDGSTRIIEYSDLPATAASRRDQRGELELWAGNLAVHVLDRSFLERVAHQADALPFHRALKRVPFLDPRGRQVEPDEPNAIKFERFIFDLLPLARRPLVVEVAKEEAFAPVKNADGAPTDTPQRAREAMMQRDRRLLRAAGAQIGDDAPVEVNPLWALDAAEAATKLVPGTRIAPQTYIDPQWRP
jgi:UDP-N-acetylglucosamine/UDP-N-acetylgalactosamine diphosphorylase